MPKIAEEFPLSDNSKDVAKADAAIAESRSCLRNEGFESVPVRMNEEEKVAAIMVAFYTYL